MIYKISMGVAALTVAACSGPVPDSNPNVRGVGFGDYESYEAQRAARDSMLEARLGTEAGEGTQIAQDTMDVLNQTSPQGGTAVASVPLATGNPNISDEQDFAAVSSRETIESDRERLTQQRQNMEIAQPVAVPDRPSGSAAPNIVSYALATTNPVGQPAYNRSRSFNEDRYRRACAEFASPDQAQAAFLAAGGPDRDRRGLDPDGDGFACFWDPSPFRTARGG